MAYFLLEGIHSVSEEAVDKAHKIANLRERDLEHISGFGSNAKTALKLHNSLYRHPIVSAKIVQKITGIKSPTNTNNLINKFVKSGILCEITGRRRNRFFLYKAYLDLFVEV